jgi:serine/threonine protein kinase
VKCPACGSSFDLGEALGIEPEREEMPVLPESDRTEVATAGSAPTIDWTSAAGGPAAGAFRPAPIEGDAEVFEVQVEADEPGMPARIGRFRIRRTLGAGGFGTVYLAFDEQLEREVALKVPRARSSARRAAEVLGEARAAARLRHPGIVQVFEVGSADGHDYIASAFVEGRSLALEIAEGAIGPDDPARVARVVRGVADALAYAHGLGIVHRDVKPANVLLDTGGKPHLADFGLAVRPEDTRRSGISGTPAYMSPEQARGEEARPASDQYALGVILYELLTARLPFDGPAKVVMVDMIHRAPDPPRSIRPEVPAGLESICLRALSKDPADRFPDCRAMAEALRSWLRLEGARRADPDRFVRLIERLPGLGRISTESARRVVGGLIVGSFAIGMVALGVFTFMNARDYFNTGVRVVIARPVESDRRLLWESRAPGPLSDGVFDLNGALLRAVGPGLGSWEATSGKRIDWQVEVRSPIRSIAMSTDGRWLALGDDDGTLVIRDLETGQDVHRISAHASTIARVAFSPDGSRVCSASWDHTASVWDVATGREEGTLRGHADAVLSACYRPDGAMIATCGPDRAILWDAETFEPLHSLEGHRGTVAAVAFSPDGKVLASSSVDRTVRLWDSTTGLAMFELRGPARALLDVAWFPDGRSIAASEGDDPDAPLSSTPATVWIWDAEDRSSAEVIPTTQGSIGRLAFRPDGSTLVGIGQDGSIGCWAAGGNQAP